MEGDKKETKNETPEGKDPGTNPNGTGGVTAQQQVRPNLGSITPETIRNKTNVSQYQFSLKDYNDNIDEIIYKNTDIVEKNLGKVPEITGKLREIGLTANRLSKTKKTLKNLSDQLTTIKIRDHNDQEQNTDIINYSFQYSDENDVTVTINMEDSVPILNPIISYYTIDDSPEIIKTFLKPGDPVVKNKLHPIEEKIFSAAIEYLKRDDILDAGSYLNSDMEKIDFPHNVVLASFFVRETNDKFFDYFRSENKKKRLDLSEKIESHAVALWKTGEKEICIIDPNNIKNSQFLISELESLHSDLKFLHLQEKFKTKNGCVVSEKDVLRKLYEGPPRDCIDIAVKIGFALNEQQKSLAAKDFDLEDENEKVKKYMDECITGAIVNQISNGSIDGKIKTLKVFQASKPEGRAMKGKYMEYANSQKDFKKNIQQLDIGLTGEDKTSTDGGIEIFGKVLDILGSMEGFYE